MEVMQEAIMNERFAPSTQNWTVCLTHFKRLHECVWQPMIEAPPDVMRIAHKPCDQCLSQETGYDTETIRLFDPDSSHLRVPVG